MCVATDEDVSQLLSEPLRSPAFTPLQGMTGLAEVVKAYESSLKTKPFSHTTVEWKVAPRRPAAAGQGKSP